jgi:hypothetical protein
MIKINQTTIFYLTTLVPRVANWPPKLIGVPFLPWIDYIIIEQHFALISMIAAIAMFYLMSTFACLLVYNGLRGIPHYRQRISMSWHWLPR